METPPRQLSLLNRRGDDVAVFSPTAVVVLNVVETEKIFQHEPGVARTFADAAISDGRLLRIHSLLLHVNPLQVIGGFERAVLLYRPAPRNALSAGDVAAALGCFAHARRRDDLA